MAAGDVWDYIFGSYVNAARALPYINDGVIVIRRLNARGAGTKPRRLCREGERADRCTVFRVAHGDALWNTADSHGISNEVDKIGRRGREDHEIGTRVSRHRWDRSLQLGKTGDAIIGCGPLTMGDSSRFEKMKLARLQLQIEWSKCEVQKSHKDSKSIEFLFFHQFLNIKIFKFYNARIQIIVVRKVCAI